jgi:hypothetical protein
MVSTDSNRRRGAILWFIATACSLLAGVIHWSKDGEIKWALFAAAVFMAIMGASTLRRSRSSGD